MPKLQHYVWLIKRFFLGAEPDNNKNLSGEKDSGAYIDANNMRFDTNVGEDNALTKINGEEVKYPNIDNACTTNTLAPLSVSYKCIGIEQFFSQDDNLNHEIEFWADKLKVAPSLIRIDGKIVLRSDKFFIVADHPLQLAVNDSCIGGEIYAVDFLNPPLIFNLKDLMVNSSMLPDENGNFICTQKYFDQFNIDDIILELTQPVDHPVFVELATAAPFPADDTHLVLLGPGFKVGLVQYAIRFVTNQGDQTAWSVATPLIPIPISLNTASPQYPSIKTFGATVGSQSTFGVHFRFRCVNILDYDFIQIKRITYTSGAALGSLGLEELLATDIDLTSQQIGIFDVYDSNSPGGPINDTQASANETSTSIATAKTLRYLNNRLFLMNIQYASRNLDNVVKFISLGNETSFPVIQNIGQAGHNDPYTRTYFRSEIRGEKASYSISFFDKKGVSSFSVPLTTDFQFPNRRDELVAGSNSDKYSIKGVVKAANVNGVVSKTFEVFDLTSAIDKTDACSFKNIYKDLTDILGIHVIGKGTDKLSEPGCSDVTPSHPLAPPPFDTLYTTDDVGYQPYHPVSQADPSVVGHNFWVNTSVVQEQDGGDLPYHPNGFAPTYYSMGLGISGVDLSSLPSWVQSFSVNRSKSAQRVFCQGLGYYFLNTAVAFGADTSKISNKIIFHIPDIEHGLVDKQNDIDDVAAGGNRYRLQVVSPLGFFTEVYNANSPILGVGASNCVDMINYCRIVRENGTINTGDDHNNVGLDGGDGYGYVAYGKWRSSTKPNNAQQFANCAGGAVLFPITTFASTTSGRQTYYTVTTLGDLFNYTQVANKHDFNETNVKNFHEPMYIINIVDTKADVSNTNIDEYLETGHYQKIESIIGKSAGTDTQVFSLVDERREDCIPDTGVSIQNKLIFINFNNTVTAWLNVKEKTLADRIVILMEIQAQTLVLNFNGTPYVIQGIYSDTENPLSAVQTDYQILFSDTLLNPGGFPSSLFIPPLGALIMVRYDSSAPLKVFGGEGIIGESVFAPFDLQSNSSGDMLTNFFLNIGWPYRVFGINDRVYQALNANGPTNYVQDDNHAKFFTDISSTGAKLRQVIAMYACESRVDMDYAFEIPSAGSSPSSQKYFPMTHYIMRPHIWTNGNNIVPQYFIDYPGEDSIWGYGGFRFLPQTNIDYSHLAETETTTGKPKVGFNEEIDFCTRVIWSQLRPINVVNDPGVRTFKPLDFFDISDDTGEIKYGYDDRTDRNGSNLYAFTNNGLCLLMTDKRVLHELTGAQLAAMGSDETSVILEQIWMSKDVGMDDEMWRSAAEYNNEIWWTNFDSVYKMEHGKIIDIAGDSKYYSRIANDFIFKVNPGYTDDIMAVHDFSHAEYWVGYFPHATHKRSFSNSDTYIAVAGDFVEYTCLTPTGDVLILPGALNVEDTFNIEIPFNSGVIQFIFTGPSVVFFGNPGESFLFTMVAPNVFVAVKITNKVFVYSEDKSHFVGTFDYSFDKFICINGDVFGARRMETHTLNKGFVINGGNINGFTVQAFSPEQTKGKEYIRYRASTSTKPARVDFYYTMDDYKNNNVISFLNTTTNAFALRDRDGWEQYISRELLGNRKRVQSQLLIVKTTHNRAEDYKMIDESIQWKLLK